MGQIIVTSHVSFSFNVVTPLRRDVYGLTAWSGARGLKTKSRQTGLGRLCDESRRLGCWLEGRENAPKNTNILLTIKHCLILFLPLIQSILLSIFFFPECLLPARENGVCIDELGLILISHHSWCGHFLVYYTTVAAYSPSSRKVDIWTTWPWQYGDNEISLMTLPERFYRLDYRLPTHVQ